jgi:cell division protein FtsB
MAKALIGYLDRTTRSAGHTSARLATENARLRARVADLEAAARRLAEENDRLVAREAARHAPRAAARPQMQPA